MDKNKKGKKGSKLAILTALNAFFFLGVLAVSAFTLYSSGPELKKVFFASDPRDDPSNVLNLQAATATQSHPWTEITGKCSGIEIECNGECLPGGFQNTSEPASPNAYCKKFFGQNAFATAVACDDTEDPGDDCGVNGSGNNDCQAEGSFDDPLGFFCNDTDGGDSVVSCCGLP